MTREELLRAAESSIKQMASLAPRDLELGRTAYLHAIACVLLAREMGEEEAVKQAEAEGEQMVAAQMQDELAAATARIRELEGILRDLDSFVHFDRAIDHLSERMFEWRRLVNRINVALGRKPIWSESEMTPPNR